MPPSPSNSRMWYGPMRFGASAILAAGPVAERADRSTGTAAVSPASDMGCPVEIGPPRAGTKHIELARATPDVSALQSGGIRAWRWRRDGGGGGGGAAKAVDPVQRGDLVALGQ